MFRAFLHSKLVLLYGSALLYSALLVSGAKESGQWHAGALKASVYWFIGTAAVLVGYAVIRPSSRDFLWRVLKPLVGITILVEFVVNVYTLPFVYELVLVAVVILFTGMEVVVRHDASADPRVRKFIEGVLVAVGLLYLGYFVGEALSDLDGFLTRENAEDFLVGPALTIALIPFLYVVAWLSLREQRLCGSVSARARTPAEVSAPNNPDHSTPLTHPRRSELPSSSSTSMKRGASGPGGLSKMMKMVMAGA